MPTYTYRCQHCHAITEHQQAMTASPLTICPTCNGTLQRVITMPNIIYKGHGFYTTDHRTLKAESTIGVPTHAPTTSKK